MECYGLKIEDLSQRCSTVSQRLSDISEMKIKLLNEMKEAISQDMINLLTNELVIPIQKRIEAKNASLTEAITTIDQDLSQAESMLNNLTCFRSRILGLYNTITIPTLDDSQLVATAKTCLSNGASADTIETIHSNTEALMSNINMTSAQHESMIHGIQEALFAMVEKEIGNFEEKIIHQNEAALRAKEEFISSLEKDLSVARHHLRRHIDINEKIQMLINRANIMRN